MKIVVIIPARGGSKSIHKKNIYPILNKPLIAYSIEAALKSHLIDRVVVTTDDAVIAQTAKKYGAEVPFMRPKEIAEDDTPDLPVFQHALNWLKENDNYEPNLVVHLWPTSPFRKDGDIDEAINILIKDSEADSVRSVTDPTQVPFKMWRRDKGKYLKNIMRFEYPEIYEKDLPPYESPRQILPETLTQTGYIAVTSPNVILKKNSMMGSRILPFYHNPETYTELDSMKDLNHTEYVLKQNYKDK